MNDFSLVDGAILLVMVVAVVRGLFIGMIRETFSIAALGAGCLAVRFGTAPAALWLEELSHGRVEGPAATWIGGALVTISAVAAVGIVGRLLQRGARSVGLGWADRVGGGVLGAAEGALVVSVVLLAVTWAVGRDHPVLEESRSVGAFEELQAYVMERSGDLPDVAAPPRG